MSSNNTSSSPTSVRKDSDIAAIDHRPYKSLESFRLALIDQYLTTYKTDVLVQEKIHGSNIVILGYYSNREWSFRLGSRKKWISSNDIFNNFQKLFENHKSMMIDLFQSVMDSTIDASKDTTEHPSEKITIRLYGEIFGGKYGQQCDKGSYKTQSDPNYCPYNDFAFFDIYVNDRCIPVLNAVELIEQSGLKVAPIIYQGPLAVFLKDFEVDAFKSVVSERYYDLPFIDTDKSTEGVTIRTIGFFDDTDDESIVLKYKQSWILENRRVNQSSPKPISNDDSLMQACIDMLNVNRLDSYKGKTTLDDFTNPRLLTTHIKAIVEDTVEDIQKEFPNEDYPNLNIKKIRGLLSKKGYPMLKDYISHLNNQRLPVESRVDSIENDTLRMAASINMMRQRILRLNQRIKC